MKQQASEEYQSRAPTEHLSVQRRSHSGLHNGSHIESQITQMEEEGAQADGKAARQ